MYPAVFNYYILSARSEEKVLTLLNEMDRVRHQNEELLQDMSACRARETEMLSFTEKITTKNVQLQSEFTAVETKVLIILVPSI